MDSLNWLLPIMIGAPDKNNNDLKKIKFQKEPLCVDSW